MLRNKWRAIFGGIAAALMISLLVTPTASAKMSGGYVEAAFVDGDLKGSIFGVSLGDGTPYCEIATQDGWVTWSYLVREGGSWSGSFKIEDNPDEPFIPGATYTLNTTCVDFDAPVGSWYPLDQVSVTNSRNDPRNVPPGESDGSNWWEWADDDGDGIPDFWETNGVWTSAGYLDLEEAGARTGRRDLFIYMDYEDGHQLPSEVFDYVKSAFVNAPIELQTTVHFINGAAIPSDLAESIGWNKESGTYDAHLDLGAMRRVTGEYGFISSGWGGGARVPQLAKYFVNLDHRGDSTIGYSTVKGSGGWVAYNVPNTWAKVLSGNWSGAATNFSQASNLLHEIGHSLGLRHYGPHSCYMSVPTIDDEGSESFEDACDHAPTHYKSVMSYAYNVLGVPEPGEQDAKRTRIDYSRDELPWKDWRAGPEIGYLTFIEGQYGEDMDFYARDRGQVFEMSLSEETVLESDDDILKGIDPAAFDAFANEFGISERPDFPSIDSTNLQFDLSNGPVNAALVAHDHAQSELALVVVEGPSHGTFTTDGLTFTYIPERDHFGEDRVVVRATNGILSSEAATLTFTNDSVAPPTTNPDPEPQKPCTGSFCSGR